MDNSFNAIMKESSMIYLGQAFNKSGTGFPAVSGFKRLWDRYTGKEKKINQGFTGRPALKALAAAAAVIIVIAVIGIIGVRSSADWSNTPFGTIRRLLNASLAQDEFSVSQDEIDGYSVVKSVVTLNGDSYSDEPVLKDFFIHGWEIDSIGSYALDVKNAGVVDGGVNRAFIQFTDSFFLTNDGQKIQVFLCWEDVISGIKTKECRVESIKTYNVRSLVIGDLEICGISDEEISEHASGSSRDFDVYLSAALQNYRIPIKDDPDSAVFVSLFHGGSSEIISLRFADYHYHTHGIINEISAESKTSRDNYLIMYTEGRYNSFIPLDALYNGKAPEVGDGIFLKEWNNDNEECYYGCVVSTDDYNNYLDTELQPAESEVHFEPDSFISDSVTDAVEGQQNAFKDAEEADIPRRISEQEYKERHVEFWKSVSLSNADSIFVVNPEYSERISERMIEDQCRYIWDGPLYERCQNPDLVSVDFCQGFLPRDIEEAVDLINGEVYWSWENGDCSICTLEFAEAQKPYGFSSYVSNPEVDEFLADKYDQDNFEFAKELVSAAAAGYRIRDISDRYLGYACTPIYIVPDGDPDDPQSCILPYTLEDGTRFVDDEIHSVVFIYTFIFEITRPVRW